MDQANRTLATILAAEDETATDEMTEAPEGEAEVSESDDLLPQDCSDC